MRSLVLALSAALALAGCDDDSTTPSAVAENAWQLPADQVIEGLRHNMTKEGIRSGILQADTALLFETGRKLDMRSVELRFFGETGRQTGTLTSETGVYDLGTGAFVARGDVVLVTQGENGAERRLETEELHYDVKGDRLWSDQPFVLREAGRVTRGLRFRSNASFSTWEVTGAQTEGGLPESGTAGVSF